MPTVDQAQLQLPNQDSITDFIKQKLRKNRIQDDDEINAQRNRKIVREEPISREGSAKQIIKVDHDIHPVKADNSSEQHSAHNTSQQSSSTNKLLKKL